MGPRALRPVVFAIVWGLTAGVPDALAQSVITPRLTLHDPAIGDQDDMCFWIHPVDRSLSTIITSDKVADRIFVYDLQGTTLQVIPIVGQPANIDIRYDIELAGGRADVVAFNNRADGLIYIFRVDPETRQLQRVDNGAIMTGPNYGLCMYHSPVSGAFYAFSTSESGNIQQYELRDEGGQVAGTRVRSWDIGGQTESCVCDEETGMAYFGEENVGIWKVGAEPGAPVAASSIAAVGDASGLRADVEGLTIYYAADGNGYLITSSQGSSDFKVYDRKPPHGHVGTFAILGVTGTDGIDVTNVSLGSAFPSGIIAVHNNSSPSKTVEICAYEDLGLLVDTVYWNPRGRLPLTFVPVHDARVNSFNPDVNYGFQPNLRVQIVNPIYNSYLKFNVSGLAGAVQSAKVWVYCTDESPGGGSIAQVSNDYRGTTTPWVEGGLTWNNAPEIGGTPLDQQGAVALNTWVEFDVTSAIVGDGTYSFGMTSSSTNIAAYSSKEGSNPPRLVIRAEAAIPVIMAFSPTSGPAGIEVTLTGQHFAGVTAVAFNGAAATFTVDSDAQLRATVPAGATTGPIRVSVPSGTATSSEPFTVTPVGVAYVPRGLTLGQNYPNPFRGRTRIRLELPRPEAVRMTVYDALGRAVRTLVDSPLPAGAHEVTWDARGDDGNPVGSGIYWLELEVQGFTAGRKLLLLR